MNCLERLIGLETGFLVQIVDNLRNSQQNARYPKEVLVSFVCSKTLYAVCRLIEEPV